MKRDFAKRERKEYNFLTEVFQFIAVYFFVMPYVWLFFRCKVEGSENIPKDESFIVAGTHSSYLDPELVSYATKRPIAYMAKKELYDVPILSPIIVALGTFAVDRKKLSITTIKTAKMIISTKKWIMAMFPQGGRDLPQKITKINPGFAYLARATKANILPVSIIGANGFSKFPFSKKLTIKIGKIIPYDKDLAQTMYNWGYAIEQLGEYEFTQEAKDKIEKYEQKELNKEQKNEVTNSEG